jgi:hypothetical protein
MAYQEQLYTTRPTEIEESDLSIYWVESSGTYPEIITCWSVREVLCDWSAERTRRLVGYIPSSDDGRTSAPIQWFDRENRCIQTRSGRIYQ